MYKYLMEAVKTLKPDSSQWFMVTGQAMGTSLNTGNSVKLYKKNQQPSFTVRVVTQCNRLPREVMESLSLERSKTQLDAVLGNLLELTLLLAGGLDWRISRGAFQPQQLRDSVWIYTGTIY